MLPLSRFTNIFLALLFLALLAGCSAVEAHRIRLMDPMERTLYAQKNSAAIAKKKATQAEKQLNEYFVKTQAGLGEMPNTVRGLESTHQVAAEAEQKISVVQGGRGNRTGKQYSSPELQALVQEFRMVRSRQLEALRPLLTDRSGNTSPESSGFRYLIYSGTFADTHSQVFHGAVMAQRTIQARRVAELQQRKDQQADATAKKFIEFLLTVAAAKEAARQELMAKGICPECHGDGVTTVSRHDRCHTCSGLGVLGSSICFTCGGSGTIGFADVSNETCEKCGGSGKYPGRD